MTRHMILATFACLILATSAAAQVSLERKFTEGSSYRTESTTKFSQKLTLAGTDVDTNNDTTAVIGTTVGKRGPDDKIRVTQKVESMQSSVEVMGQKYEFDSANPDDKGSS